MTSVLQQTNETIRANIQAWHALHSVSVEQGQRNRDAYESEKVRKYKLRLIESFRAKREA